MKVSTGFISIEEQKEVPMGKLSKELQIINLSLTLKETILKEMKDASITSKVVSIIDSIPLELYIDGILKKEEEVQLLLVKSIALKLIEWGLMKDSKIIERLKMCL